MVVGLDDAGGERCAGGPDWTLWGFGVTIQYRSDYTGVDRPQAVARAARCSQGALYRRGPKRALDIALVLVVSLPVLLVVGLFALLVRRDGHPAFYSQDRIGRDGRRFRLWKLRTMVPDAEAALEVHLAADPAAAAEWRVHQKLVDDPRVTPVGHLLRASSLDELPQLWNVLRGDMSLVGPRPMMPSQEALYPGNEYYDMRPGLTGFWQIAERSATSFSDRARFDGDYYNRMSFGTDVGVMTRTIGVVIRQTGF